MAQCKGVRVLLSDGMLELPLQRTSPILPKFS